MADPQHAPTPPHRVRLSRKKGWRLPPGVIKVDRSTVFGNPFIAGEPNGLGWGDVRDAEHAVWLYRHWLTTPARSIVFEADRHTTILERLPALAGKDLACWCTAGGTCHADVLLDLANRPNVTAWSRTMLGREGQLPARGGLETTFAVAQLLKATGQEPADADQLGSALAALRERALVRPSAVPP